MPPSAAPAPSGITRCRTPPRWCLQVRQPRGVMPRYPTQFVSEQDLADIYSYVASIPAGGKRHPYAEKFLILKTLRGGMLSQQFAGRALRFQYESRLDGLSPFRNIGSTFIDMADTAM